MYYYLTTIGFKYGIWIVLNPKDVDASIKFIPHVTVMCNMTYDNAYEYYRELLWRGYEKINIVIHRPTILFQNMYKESPMVSWGHYVTMHPKTYLDMENLSEKYKGSFSDNPHISLDYTTVQGGDYKGKDKIQGTICLVDITSDNPRLWKIIV